MSLTKTENLKKRAPVKLKKHHTATVVLFRPSHSVVECNAQNTTALKQDFTRPQFIKLLEFLRPTILQLQRFTKNDAFVANVHATLSAPKLRDQVCDLSQNEGVLRRP